MRRFRAPSFAAAMSELARLQVGLDLGESLLIDTGDLASALDDVERALEGELVSRAVAIQIERCRRSIQENTGSRELAVMLRELHNNVLSDLTAHWYLVIPDYQRGLYEQVNPPFGTAVAGKFSEASRDIASAARCLAMDEWTACVFHSMRVIELGLRRVAIELDVSTAASADYESWGTLIDQIERAIKDIGQEPRSTEKAHRLRFYSAIGMEMRYFKDAWRNHVSHSRVTYDESQARAVFAHVRDFMQQLAGA